MIVKLKESAMCHSLIYFILFIFDRTETVNRSRAYKIAQWHWLSILLKARQFRQEWAFAGELRLFSVVLRGWVL